LEGISKPKKGKEKSRKPLIQAGLRDGAGGNNGHENIIVITRFISNQVTLIVLKSAKTRF
jgi:hypothetical protein